MNRNRLWYGAAWFVVAAACHPDSTTATPPVPNRVVVISGDGQQADPQDVLDQPVRFQVIDGEGHTRPGVTVRLAVPIGGGSVQAPTEVTDSTGAVSVVWTMGSLGGVQTLQAWVNGVLMATASATTCDPSQCFPPQRLSSTISAATLLTLATYDSSGQAVHPDVVRGHGRATGFWLAITPYTDGNSSVENPSIFRSLDADSWVVPQNATNPVVRPPPGGYLSDPDMVVTGDQRLWLFYRSVVSSQNIINLMHSMDGVAWDTPNAVITVPSHEAVSPTVVHGTPNRPWQMWSVNAGPLGCSSPATTVERRTSPDGTTWGPPSPVQLVQPGQSIWHIDVQWIPARAEYWALYNTYPNGTSCATNAVYLARSPDGINWTVYPSPIAHAGMIDAFKDIVYRSTFMTNPAATKVKLWISGAAYTSGTGYIWETATVSMLVTDFLTLAASPANSIESRPFRRDLPPPERDVGP